ncbi:MAG: ATP-binding protein, partial [Alphaproteobacteria bacterium]|nr:ATP-binding protein [Alphaproteobacteria bacterium]
MRLTSTYALSFAIFGIFVLAMVALYAQSRARALGMVALEKARLLEAAIAYGKDSVVITNAQFKDDGPHIIYVNESFTRITGYTAEEVMGKNPRFLQGKDTDRNVLARLKACLTEGKPFSGEIKNYSKDGIAYWLDINVIPVRNSVGKITHYASIQRDVTDRKAFEKELTITKEAAEVANRAKGDFLANMSHELRTPMNGIIGLSDLLLDLNLNAEQKELGEAINVSARNLLILLNDILDLSKIEAGELTLENVSFDLRKTVRQTIELLAPIASRKGVVLESTINPIVPERLMGDPGRLQQIMTNLVSNAIKFTEVGYVRLDITTQRDGARDVLLQMRVEDTGIGIPDDKRDIIFEKFTQADVSTARKYGGTGLGLAITKELVEMMGGRISFDSAENKG